jgi:O-antigen ligase
MLAGLSLSLTLLVGQPQLTLAVLLATLSCDQVLTLRASDSMNLRLAHLCALALVLRLVFQRGARLGWRVPVQPLQPLMAYLLLASVGGLFSENLPKTVGYVAWAAADVFAVFAVVLELVKTEAGFRQVRRAWAAGAALAAAFGLVQLALGLAHQPVPLVGQKLGEFPRINGFNYEPAYYALYLESVAAVYLGRWVRGGRGTLKAGAFGLFLVAPAALSMSRSGWLGMGGLLAYVGWHGVRRASPRALAATVATLGAAVCMLGLLLPPKFLAQAPRMAAMALDAREASSTAPRLGLVGQAFRIFLANPVLGVGLGGYGGYVVTHGEFHVPGEAHDLPHLVTTNLWLECAAELGLLGVGVLLWFLGALVLGLWRSLRTAPDEERAWAQGLLLSVLLVFGVLYQFNQTLWRLDVWVLLALAWGAVVRERARRMAAVAA